MIRPWSSHSIDWADRPAHTTPQSPPPGDRPPGTKLVTILVLYGALLIGLPSLVCLPPSSARPRR